MEFLRLANCCLSRLERLKLTVTAGALAYIDRIHVQFLSRHPTIQGLVWVYTLKRLSMDISLASATSPFRRKIKCFATGGRPGRNLMVERLAGELSAQRDGSAQGLVN